MRFKNPLSYLTTLLFAVSSVEIWDHYGEYLKDIYPD